MTKDPYRYFRIEAREIVEALTRGVLELEKGAASKEVALGLLRFAHTLKGAARVVRLPEIAEDAHAIEEMLAPYRDGGGPESDQVGALLRRVDAVAAKLAALGTPEKKKHAPTAEAHPQVEAPIETVRIELEEMNVLLEGLAEATVQVDALLRESAGISRAQRLAASLVERLHPRHVVDPSKTQQLAEDLHTALEQLGRSVVGSVEAVSTELSQVRESANRLRLLPVSSVFASLERATRDAAHSLRKKVTFRASGGESRLDAHVLAALRDAVLHLVRNSVAHGIEPESERTLAGKPPTGEVHVEVERRGARIAFRCKDDGRGIDVDALRRVAARQGLLDEAAASALADDDVFRLVLKGGLSTTDTVTEVSGRGVGLDVVRETAARLKGEVTITNNPGRGAWIEICVPVSLSSLLALEVETAGVSVSIPLEAVRRTLRITEADIARSPEGDTIAHDDRVIPFLPLRAILRAQEAPARAQTTWSAVVVESQSSLVAIGADRLVRTANVVVKPLPPWAEVEPVVAGASLDTRGNPQLVLDPGGLVAAGRSGRGARVTAAPKRKPVLVIDDSLTTRMLEQSILESAGYEVKLATSAEQGLEMARSEDFSVFIVDVEMPGMNGFEFVALTRSDPVLRNVPAVLVTSRGSKEDRSRGHDAGARAYIDKGEFDQSVLLRTLRELIGS